MKLKFKAEHEILRVPNNISAWTNLADGEDVVAIMGALDADLKSSDTGVHIVDQRVLNAYRRPDGEPNHHKSYGYPREPELSHVARTYTVTPGHTVRSTGLGGEDEQCIAT